MALDDARYELDQLQDAIDWKHVKPKWRVNAARWMRKLVEAKTSAALWHLASELADTIKPNNLLTCWHAAERPGEPPAAVSWANDTHPNDAPSVLVHVQHR